VVELIATRNIIAHNRGVVDERYIRSVPSSGFQIGDSRTMEVDELFQALALLHRVVCETDEAAIQKFRLDSVSIAISTKLEEPEAPTPASLADGQSLPKV